MEIEHLLWTVHAELRLRQRGLTRDEVERTIRDAHHERVDNEGDADWRVYGTRQDGQRFVVVYDHPAGGDERVGRVVSVWPLRSPTHGDGQTPRGYPWR